MGVDPWIKYADIFFDTRLMAYYAVRLRGLGWEYYAHIQNGDLEEQVVKFLEEKKGNYRKTA